MAVTSYEPFSDWLEEKIDLPIYEEIPPLDQRPKQLKSTHDTAYLLQEFEYIYDEVSLHNGALTPPQTPPYCPESPVLHELTPPVAYPVHFCNPMVPGAGYVGSNVDDLMVIGMPTPGTESLERELAVVDELVRTRAEDMDVSCDPWESGASSPVSDRSSMSPSSSSCDSNFGDASNDPEWTPVEVPAPVPRKNRRKPYSRPVEDKKLRKKEQNKNAATRYRQKKKQEVEVILDEEKGLEDKNGELHEKVTDLQREIKYLKGLMRDMFKAKGLLK